MISQITKSKISVGFVLGYMIFLFVMIAIGVLATIRLNQINVSVDNLTNNLTSEKELSQEIVNQVLLTRLSANKYVRTQSQADLDRFNEEFEGLEILLDQADQQIIEPERIEMLKHIKLAVEEYGDTFNKVAELIITRQRIQSGILDVEGLLIENKLTALRIHVISLNDPMAFLALSNAQNAYNMMRLNTTKYREEGDVRYVILFDARHQQAQTAFSSLETILQDSTQHENLNQAIIAVDAFRKGFHKIHTDNDELNDLFRSKMDILEPEISNTATEIAISIDREFEAQNATTKTLILQTRFMLLITTTISVLAGLGLGIVINRRITEREQAEYALREAHDKLELRVKNRTTELKQTNEILQIEIAQRMESEERIKLALEGTDQGLWDWDIESGLITFDENWVQIMGYPPGEMEFDYGRWERRIHTDSRPVYAEALSDYLEGREKYFGLEYQINDKSGEWRWIWMRGVCVAYGKQGEPLRMIGTQRDITSLKRTNREIEKRRRYLEGVLVAAPDAIITADIHHRIVEWNQGAEKIFGYSSEEVIGKNIDSLITNSDILEEAAGFTSKVIDLGEVSPVETVRYRKDGSAVDVILAGSQVIVGDEPAGAVVVYTDITNRKRMEEQLAQMATHDYLTDLPNRRLFDDRLDIAIANSHRSQKKLAVIMLDLDNFKVVNDTLGHNVGDKLLQAVSERLTSILRKSDTVARMGGDEFILLLPEIAQVEDAAKLAQKILESVRGQYEFEGNEIKVTASIGIALYPDDGENNENLMKKADMAMYSAKDKGRDRYQHFQPTTQKKR